MDKSLPYSPLVPIENFIFTSGQIGRNPDTLETALGIENQTKQCLDNLKFHLESHGVTMADVIKVTVFLTDMNDFEVFNNIYESYFSKPYPARTCVGVKELPKVSDNDLVVEIEAIAYKAS